jgi:hypothetical protein
MLIIDEDNDRLYCEGDPMDGVDVLKWVSEQIATPPLKTETLVMNTKAYRELLRQVPTFENDQRLTGRIRVVRSEALDDMSGDAITYRLQEQNLIYHPAPQYLIVTPPLLTTAVGVLNTYWTVWAKTNRCRGANGPGRGARRLAALRRRAVRRRETMLRKRVHPKGEVLEK